MAEGPAGPCSNDASADSGRARVNNFAPAPRRTRRAATRCAGSETRHLAERSPPAPSRNQSPTSRHVFASPRTALRTRPTSRSLSRRIPPRRPTPTRWPTRRLLPAPPVPTSFRSAVRQAWLRAPGVLARRGPAGRHQGPPPVREFGPGPGPRFDGPPGWFGPPPRNRRSDSDARDHAPTVPAMRMSIAVPVGTATAVVRMVRVADMNRGPDGPRPETWSGT